MSGPKKFISIFARNCSVRKIDAAQAKAFLEQHHRFGWSKCRHCYGLFIEKAGHDRQYDCGALVAVASFSNARRWQKDDKTVRSYEWVRYASIEGTRVIGGMGKLMNAFIEELKPDDIMSYAPLINGDEGEVYTLLGFELEGIKDFPGGKSAKYRKKLQNFL